MGWFKIEGDYGGGVRISLATSQHNFYIEEKLYPNNNNNNKTTSY